MSISKVHGLLLLVNFVWIEMWIHTPFFSLCCLQFLACYDLHRIFILRAVYREWKNGKLQYIVLRL